MGPSQQACCPPDVSTMVNTQEEDTPWIMRITRGKVHPGTWDAFEQAYKATVVVKSEHIDGLRGRWLVQDIDDPDAGYSVSFWESAEAIQAYEQSDFYRQEILPTLHPFFVGEFTTTYCTVKVNQSFDASMAYAALEPEYWEDFALFY